MTGTVDTDRSVSMGDARDASAERILAAADALFCSRGFQAVSVRDIAERAGVKKASVFYHFQNKEALFAQVLDGYYEAHAEALRAARQHGGDSRQRLHTLLDAFMDFMEDHSRYVKLVHIEIASGGPALPKIREGLHKLLRLVEDILGDEVPCDGPLSAKQFFVSFSGIVNTYALYAPALTGLWTPDPESAAARRERREHVHWLADALFASLRAAAPE